MRKVPRIAIVGAGPGGLVCARILQNQGIPITVFEREPSPSWRPQGGILDIQEDTGQFALEAAGLLPAFLAVARPEGQELRQLNQRGELLHHHLPAEGELGAPEIDRAQLRSLLLESLEPGTVRWNSALSGAKLAADGTVTLAFGDGNVENWDLVIGADGAWSKVRPLLSDAKPIYSGITFIEANFRDVDTRHPDIAALVGQGTMTAKVGRLGLLSQRSSTGSVRTYISFRGPQGWNDHLDGDVEALRECLLRLFADFDDSLLRLVSDNDGDYIRRPLFVLPERHVWEAKPGVTLLGDAAHLMPPAGVGANLAMLDGVELAQAIIDQPTVEKAVSGYEELMLPRSIREAERTGKMMAELIPDNDSAEGLFPPADQMRARR